MSLTLALLLALATPRLHCADVAGAVQASAPARFADDEVVAQAFDARVTWKDLEPLFVARRANSEEGRAALRHLCKSRMLAAIAREQGLQVPRATIDARVVEIERQMLLSGEPGGLTGHLERVRMTRSEFRELLELAVVQETLTRRALGKSDDAAVTGEQQELWLDEVLAERKLELKFAPWKDGIAARATGLTVSGAEFLLALRRTLTPESIREDCFELLREKRVLARMPDLAPGKLAQAVEAELAQRREDIARDPKYKGIPWEQLLAAQGIVPESMADDPTVRCFALSRLWVERSYDEATLKRVYADEREHFDTLYGAAIDARMIFLRGAELPRDDLRSFKDAERLLDEIKKRIHSLEDFQREARGQSEDGGTREQGGSLGYVTTGNPRVPQAIRELIGVELVAQPTLVASSAGYLRGPVRLPNGRALVWLGARRPAPAWAEMIHYVRRELRQRFLDEALPRGKMVDVFAKS